jgi:ArsR family transcriptional regulator, arsenate/arsenite/antimonite-responsive transcriptional repressor
MEFMETRIILAGLSALAQASRLAVFRHLVQAGPAGACPGDIAQALDIRPSTLSFHLKALAHGGLVEAEQQGRSILYRADFEAMRGLVDYLTENCCGGDAAACAPQGCTPAAATAKRRRA